MRGLVFELSIPRYLAVGLLGRIFPKRYFSGVGCLHLKDVPEPQPLSSDWIKIKTEACGICGSDLAALTGKDSFSMEPYASFPTVMGHEAIGTVVSSGERVAIEGVLPCVTRNIDPPCPACQRGEYSLCANFTSGNLKPGMINGFNASVGGGFSEHMIAHKSQLFPIDPDLPTEVAVLIDPIASALQPAATHLPSDDDTLLVYGGGVIGILLVQLIRALGSKCRIISIVRHTFQEEWARRSGANDVIRGNLFDSFEELTGVDQVFDCVASSETIDNSLRFLRKRGKLVMVGCAGVSKFDASPIWFNEIDIVGSSMFSHVTIGGKRKRTYQAAIDLINEGKLKLDGLVTHTFPISDYDTAINTAINKRDHQSIKVVFKY